MAQLTWREMTAPDVSTSLRGYDQFTNLLNSALGGARSAIQNIDQKNKDLTNNQIQLALATAQDPAAVKAALTDPAQLAKLDPSRVNAQTIAAIGARPGQLTQQAAQELALKDSTRLFDQAVATDARAPLLIKAQQLSDAIGRGEKGAQGQYDAFMAANPGLLDGIGYKTAADVQKGVFDARKSGQDYLVTGNNDTRAWNQDRRSQNEDVRAGLRLAMDQGRYNWEKEDRNTAKVADSYIAQITSATTGAGDLPSILTAITNSGLDKADGTVQSAVYARLGQRFPNLFGDTSGGTGPTGSGGAGGGSSAAVPPALAAIAGTSARTMGWSPIGDNAPASLVNKIGLISNKIGADPNRPLTKDQFLSLDMTQLEGKPAAPNNFGNMKNTDGSWRTFKSPQEYQAAQRAWLERRWNEGARTVTDAVLGRKIGSTAEVGTNMALRAGIEMQGPVNNPDMISAGTRRSVNPLDVVKSLKADPAFSGTNSDFLNDQLKKIVEMGTVTDAQGHKTQTINYDQAAVILKEARRVNKGNGWLQYGSSWFNWDLSGRINKDGDRIDFGYVKRAVDAWKSGNAGQTAARQQDLAVNSAQLQAAQQAVDAATANLTRLAEMANYNPRLRQQVEVAQQVLRERQRNLAEVQAAVAQDAGFPRQAPPAPRRRSTGNLNNAISAIGAYRGP